MHVIVILCAHSNYVKWVKILSTTLSFHQNEIYLPWIKLALLSMKIHQISKMEYIQEEIHTWPAFPFAQCTRTGKPRLHPKN